MEDDTGDTLLYSVFMILPIWGCKHYALRCYTFLVTHLPDILFSPGYVILNISFAFKHYTFLIPK
jgi:hypothetical protein